MAVVMRPLFWKKHQNNFVILIDTKFKKMESTLDIRKKIHEFIDSADERILRIFKGIIDAEEENSELEPSEYPQVPDYVYDRIEEEREKYLKGEIKTSSWEEVKERLKKL